MLALTNSESAKVKCRDERGAQPNNCESKKGYYHQDSTARMLTFPLVLK